MAYRATAYTESRKADTRETLIQAAIDSVAEHGFAGTSVAAIARQAGIATGTVYRYFPSQADLFVEVFKRLSQPEVALLAYHCAGPGSCAERLNRAISVFAERALRAPVQAYALIAEPVAPQVEQARLEFRQRYAGHLQALVAEGCTTGEFLQQDATFSASAIVGVIAEVLVGTMTPGADQPRPTSIAAIATFCLRAVAGHATTHQE